MNIAPSKLGGGRRTRLLALNYLTQDLSEGGDPAELTSLVAP